MKRLISRFVRFAQRVPEVRLATIACLGILGLGVSTSVAQGQSPHSYFDSLVARPDHWRSYSLRSPAQLARRMDGGYAQGNDEPLMVTYSPSTDSDPHAQDAAKVVIPPFTSTSGNQLVAPVDATSLTLQLSDLNGDITRVSTGFNAKGRQIRIGNEIVIANTQQTPLNRTTGVVTLSQRGAYGTTASSHAAGTKVYGCGNSLSNQVRVPVDTSDGATWLVTWDGYFTDSYLNNGIGNFKAFQLSSDRSIWLEPNVHFSGGGIAKPPFDPALHVGSAGMARSYNAVGGPADYALSSGNSLGPGIVRNGPIEPAANGFLIVHPNRWVRWWVRIEQRANDYDYMDLWIADEVTGPVQIYNRVPLSVRETNGVATINEFYIEFNTSTAQLPAGRTTDFRDLVAYVRNVVVLKNPPADIYPLLIRPGATQPLPRPGAPANFRSLGSS